MRLGGWIFGLLFALSGFAAHSAEIAWLNDSRQALQRAGEVGRPVLLFVSKPDCKYCSRMMDKTYANPQVAADVMADFVPLAVDKRQARALIKELKITAYPTTVLITADAVVLDKIKGFVKPEEMRKRLAATVERQNQTAGVPARRHR